MLNIFTTDDYKLASDVFTSAAKEDHNFITKVKIPPNELHMLKPMTTVPLITIMKYLQHTATLDEYHLRLKSLTFSPSTAPTSFVLRLLMGHFPNIALHILAHIIISSMIKCIQQFGTDGRLLLLDQKSATEGAPSDHSPTSPKALCAALRHNHMGLSFISDVEDEPPLPSWTSNAVVTAPSCPQKNARWSRCDDSIKHQAYLLPTSRINLGIPSLTHETPELLAKLCGKVL